MRRIGDVYQPGRRCAKCGRRYLRASLVRLWVVTNPGHREGWVRVLEKLCTDCFKAPEAQATMKEIDPRWRLLKPTEKIAGVTPPKGSHEKK